MKIEHFYKIFVKSIFKESIVEMLRDIETTVLTRLQKDLTDTKQSPKDKNLSLDITNYQRKLMLHGVQNAAKELQELTQHSPRTNRAKQNQDKSLKPTKKEALSEHIVMSLKKMKLERKGNDSANPDVQTYEEFIDDPEGIKFKAKKLKSNTRVIKAKNEERFNEKRMVQMLDTSGLEMTKNQKAEVFPGREEPEEEAEVKDVTSSQTFSV